MASLHPDVAAYFGKLTRVGGAYIEGIDPEKLERRCPLDNERHEAITATSIAAKLITKASRGIFSVLPTEIWDEVLAQLDFQTLTTLRSVNRHMRQAIDNVPEYRVIIKHIPEVVRAFLSTGLASTLSCRALYTILCKAPTCSLCGNSGFYLYLPTVVRICFHCRASLEQSLPMSLPNAKSTYGLDNKTVGHLPTLLSIPGPYGFSWSDYQGHKRRIRLVDSQTARDAGIKVHGTVQAMTDFVEARKNRQIARHELRLKELRLKEWVENEGNVTQNSPPRKRRCPYRPSVPDYKYRYMAVVGMPWLDIRIQVLEWGVHCKGCLPRELRADILGSEWRPYNDTWRIYTKAGFMEHFLECEASQETLKRLVGKAEGSDG